MASPLIAQEKLAQDNEPAQPENEKFVGVPFLFSSKDWGTAIGGAGLLRQVGQPQMSLFGSAVVSSNGSWLGYARLSNIMMPGFDQWLLDIEGRESRLTETNDYVPGNTQYPDEQAGSNDSSQDNVVRTSTEQSRYQLNLKYVLPIGQGQGGALSTLKHLNQGNNEAGYAWNPMTSGVTSVLIQPFYERQQLGDEALNADNQESMGVRFGVEYDNRNASQLPTRGNKLSFLLSHDWGSDNRAQWTTWEFEASQFFNLGGNDLMRQQVIALNAWLADTPSWNDTSTINGQQVYNRPSNFSGVSLGGWDKLRGFENERFFGRSAISYSAEYRIMPQWQPLDELSVIQGYDIPWWQWTLFLDAGRVSDTFSLSELHSDMKFSAGGGIRFQVEGVTVRTEVATSKEDTQFRIFVNQPF